MNKVLKLGRPAASGRYESREELEKHVKLFFTLFPHAMQQTCADLTGTSIATINRIINNRTIGRIINR